MRQGLEVAVSEDYPENNSEKFDQMVDWRIADSPPLADYIKQMVAGSKFDASSGIEEIQKPALVLHGNEDRVVPVSNAESLSEKLPDAKLRVFENAGHLVFVERADEVNAEILSFLQKRPYPVLDELSSALRDRLRKLRNWINGRGKRNSRRKKKTSRRKSGLLATARAKLTRSR